VRRPGRVRRFVALLPESVSRLGVQGSRFKVQGARQDLVECAAFRCSCQSRFQGISHRAQGSRCKVQGAAKDLTAWLRVFRGLLSASALTDSSLTDPLVLRLINLPNAGLFHLSQSSKCSTAKSDLEPKLIFELYLNSL